MARAGHNMRHKRIAMHMLELLPEDPAEAAAVMEYVNRFWRTLIVEDNTPCATVRSLTAVRSDGVNASQRWEK